MYLFLGGAINLESIIEEIKENQSSAVCLPE